MKILIAAPTSSAKNYCFHEWVMNVRCIQQYFDNAADTVDVLLADNTPANRNNKVYRQAGIKFLWINPQGKSNIQYICESHEAIRQYVLVKKYDFLLHLETDIFPPVQIISQLLFHKRDVVAAPYHYLLGEESRVLIQHMEKSGIGERFAYNELDDISFMDGTLKQVYACGLGCILIAQSVLKKIPFRFEPTVNAHPDTFFALDLWRSRIATWLDTSILCRHENQEWVFI